MSSRGVNLNRLRYFADVCRSGSFSLCAEKHNISQSALSRQVKLLEEEFGFPLFLRNGRGVIPTVEGKTLLHEFEHHFGAIERKIQSLREQYASSKREIILGVCSSISNLFIADLVEDLAKTFPNALLNIIEASSGDIRGMMENRHFDLVLTYKPKTSTRKLYTELFSEKLIVLGSKTNQLLGKAINLEKLSSLKLLLPNDSNELRLILDDICIKRGIKLKPHMEMTSLHAIRAIIGKQDFNFATILPYYSVKDEIDSGNFSYSEFNENEMYRTIALYEYSDKSGNYKITNYLSNFIKRKSLEIKSTHRMLF